MELICKHFSELTASELYEIYRLRVSVFVVEQNCAYQDVDEADRTAWHIWLQDEGGIAAYARVLAPGTVFPDVSIGRVTAVRRREGLGRRIVLAAIGAAKKHFRRAAHHHRGASYVKTLYTALGFTQTGPEFLEDGIPHVPMQLQL